MAGLAISNLLDNQAVDENYQPLPNVDMKYGPYVSTAAALSAIPKSKRSKGLTVGVNVGSEIVEYWFKSGVEDANLVAKNTGGGGSSTGGYTLFVGNNISEDTNTNLDALFPSAVVKDMVVDATLGNLYLKYQDGKWIKFNGTILTDTAPTVTDIRDVRMISMK